ncbi:phytanoyl-CoA dioxygenase family protein [Dyadobacter crusticola]|uniref:phytanoyl-CoA dioxygenase family protein n=1 Tax=Dyadobacter crusticola TaxID=292407 RepID=UPI0004E16B15|nr:phytanoyl-CoA dioxygenase family protein [Dyadobacter crusticola]
MNSQLFTPEFESVNAKEIAGELKNGSGYYVCREALKPEVMNKLMQELPEFDCLVNNNHLGFVKAYNSNYLGHTLAVSRQCYDIVTSEKLRAVCRSFFDKPYKLCNQRIYQTHTASHLPWHTDNNLQSGNQFDGKHDMPGLMFMVYLSDVHEMNPFQLIPYSHQWSQQNRDQFFQESFIDKNYGKDMVTVRAPKGTLIICTTNTVHRAEPFHKQGFKRLTLLFQVDEVSADHAGHGERLLVNPAFVTDRNPEILDYLGFGVQSDYPAFPETSVATMLVKDIVSLQRAILPKTIKSLMISLIKKVLPGAVANTIRMNLAKRRNIKMKTI